MLEARATAFYSGRESELSRLFGSEVHVDETHVVTAKGRWPVVDDVIVTLPADRLPPRIAARLGLTARRTRDSSYAPDIQTTFGEEWTRHDAVLEEHAAEFDRYFDLIDVDRLTEMTVGDLGCGNGRWATYVAPKCASLVVADFSDAILVARENLRDHGNVIFVLGDVLHLPFAEDAFDLAYCLGVLHHLPVDALDACRKLEPVAPELLVYLYYALDNRPAHYRSALRSVTAIRHKLSKIEDRRTRNAVTWLIAVMVYLPLSRLGRVLPRRLASSVPLADTYGHSSLRRMRQDVEDRFFTRIEQRFSREQIAELRDTFAEVVLSDKLPYWHFLCRRAPGSVPAGT
jgi:SAM-dependent methyltransferase